MRAELLGVLAIVGLVDACSVELRPTTPLVASSREGRPGRPALPAPTSPDVPELATHTFASGATAWVRTMEAPARITLSTRRGDDGAHPESALAFALEACSEALTERTEIGQVWVDLDSAGVRVYVHAASAELPYAALWRALVETFPACATPEAVRAARDRHAQRWAGRRDTESVFAVALAELDGRTIAVDAFADLEAQRITALDVDGARSVLSERFSADDLLVIARGTGDEIDVVMRPALDAWPSVPRAAAAEARDVRARRSVLRHERFVVGELRLLLAARGPEPRDPSRAAYELAVAALGGAASSALFSELRETEGLTYGAGARIAAVPRATLLAEVSFAPDEALEGTRTFLRLFREASEVSSASLDAAVRRRWAQLRASLAEGSTHPLAEAWGRGHATPEAVEASWRALADVTPNDASAAARDWIDARRAVLVVVGDAGALRNAAVVREGDHFVLRELAAPAAVSLDDDE
jgi:hypothetical protein